MDKSITTGLFIVVGMVLALMLFNVAYPAVIEGSDAIASMANRQEEKMRTQIRVLHATGELDQSQSFKDTNGNGTFDVFIWVKNVGETRVMALNDLDVFFGPEGNFTRIPHHSAALPGAPYWTWKVENDSTATDWQPKSTLRVTINFGVGSLAAGRYFFKITTSSGISDDYGLGI
jgi:hypothetical protein